MNTSIRSFFILIVFAGLLIAGCQGPDKRNPTGADSSVLHNPPFGILTDSIRQSSPADAAGLYFRRGELLSRNNLHELAADDYKKSWELAPEEPTGIHLASTLSILGRTEDAISLLGECMKKFPDNNNFPRMLGDCYVQSGMTTKALALYDDLTTKDSSNFEAWYEKGLLLERMKDTTGAITALKKAYALQPMNTYALELAHMYAEQGDKTALQLCDQVLLKDVTHELLDPLFIKGIYFSNTGQYKKAILQFDSCIARDWKFTDAHLEKGIAYYKQKNYEEAMNAFQMTIKVSNTYPDGYYWAGRCEEAMGRKEEAMLYYQRAYALDKTFTEAADAMRRLK